MIEVNRHIRFLAVWPWLSIWEVDGDRSWVRDRLERFNSIRVAQPEGIQRVVSLLEADLVPWLRSWPAEPLELLRQSLEYDLAYDRDSLGEVTNHTYLAFDGGLFLFWRPLWDGVFGGPVNPKRYGAYRLLSDRESKDALSELEIEPPKWKWLDEVESKVEAEQLTRSHFVFVYESPNSRSEPAEDRIRRYGREVRFQGMRALSAAREHHRLNPGALWQVPDTV